MNRPGLISAVALAVGMASGAHAACTSSSSLAQVPITFNNSSAVFVQTLGAPTPMEMQTITFPAFTPPTGDTLVDICAVATASYTFKDPPPDGSSQAATFTIGGNTETKTFGALHTPSSGSFMIGSTIGNSATSFDIAVSLALDPADLLGDKARIDSVSLYAEVAPAPEPETWALLTIGSAMTGAVLRRRRTALS
jgi:hypothetical protein